MDRKTLRITGSLLLIIVFVFLAGCGGQKPAAAGASATTQSTDEIAPVRTDSGVIAEGKVVPVDEASLSFITGGVIGEVLVAEGDTVQPGQPLMRLVGNEKLQAAISAADLELLTARQAVEDLKTGLPVERSQVELTLANAQKALDQAKTRMYSQDWQRGSKEQVDIARANYIIAEDGVKQATKYYDQVDDRPQDDPIRAERFSQLAAAKQLSAKALANLNYLLNKPNKMDVDIANANLTVAQANMNEAVRRMNLLKDGPDPNQMALAQARVQNAELSLKAAKASLNDLELRAPFAGTVTDVALHIGEFASPGVAMVHLADFTNWKVETTDLTELNIVRVRMGQPAMVHFDALKDVGIIGRVTKIKSLGENRQGDIVYTVTLKLDPTDAALKWNMTASVTFLEKEE
jgi:HlyD family secretion protein